MKPFGTVVESTEMQAIPAAIPKKNGGWLPLLTVLFLISYGLMTMLIVEQGQTIESQRALIRELFRDSTELSAAKGKALRDGRTAQSAVPQNPSSQNRSGQAPSQQGTQIQIRPKSQAPRPSKPASDLKDSRRALVTI